MAASSSSTHLSGSKYDAFLSFRGEDTRLIFVDHLYTYLVVRGIKTFKDDEELHKGECIHPSLMKAIEESQIAIIVFSENYADSSSCLRELAHIMECKDERQLIVVPIFYGVVPAEVKDQTGSFGKGFAKQASKNSGNIESWRKALAAAARISGWEPKKMAHGHESVSTSIIAKDIFQKLRPILNGNEDLIGIETRVQDLKSYLKVGPVKSFSEEVGLVKSCLEDVGSGGVRMVGIWGVGGCGKTTIAYSLYNEISDAFDSCCFVRNIREASNKYGLEKLQEKIIFDVLQTEMTVWNVEEGRQLIKSKLCQKKVLIVLDDVACHEHLEALAGSHDWFGDGSRIIITTTDKHLLNAHKVDATYNVSLLNKDEAIRLFYKYARWKSSSEEEHGKVFTHSNEVISYAGGLPLALKVLGLFLCDKLNTCKLLSTWSRLNDMPDCDFVKNLKVSYDRLRPQDQELFLDIACFFRHWPKDDAMMILDACGFYPIVGVKVLKQSALLSIKNGLFDMHDAVQKMGYYIIRGKYINNPEKHSRVWRYEDIENLCTWGETVENNKIQVLHSPDRDAPPNLLKVVANMKKLRLINVRQNVKTPVEEPIFLSNGLRWISWEGYPAHSLPTNFQPTKLVGLKLKNGLQEKLWTEFKYIPSLKVLDLHGSDNLTTTPDFSGLPNLETLMLSGCKSLREIHSSIGNHVKLVYLDLEDCIELEVFPPIITMQKLETLVLSGCSKLVNFPEFRQTMDSLKYLNMAYTGIEVVPSSIGQYCTNLESLRVTGCSKLVSIHMNSQCRQSIEAQSSGILSISVGGGQ
ncbi:disease resistance protein Roq1-like [Bidens hawaiensis]|uniref:disease resistance protein Roq1-like n=1 Tax=Bidens hawaiensis TaxID=980011 RepID=UPI00404B766F